MRSLSIEDQLEHWCTLLAPRAKGVEEIRRSGGKLRVDCFLNQPWPIIMYLLPELVAKLNDLSVPVKFTIYTNESTP